MDCCHYGFLVSNLNWRKACNSFFPPVSIPKIIFVQRGIPYSSLPWLLQNLWLFPQTLTAVLKTNGFTKKIETMMIFYSSLFIIHSSFKKRKVLQSLPTYHHNCKLTSGAFSFRLSFFAIEASFFSLKSIPLLVYSHTRDGVRAKKSKFQSCSALPTCMISDKLPKFSDPRKGSVLVVSEWFIMKLI